MSLRIGLILAILWGIFFNSFAQTEIDECFKNLKSGGILVQLRSNYITLNAIKGKNDQLYNKIVKERDIRNQEIIDAFKSFNYCPVYFFYSNNSKLIFEQKFDSIILNQELKIANNLPKFKNNYLLATFNTTYIDTSAYNSYFVLYAHNNETGNLEKRYRWDSHNQEGSLNALILMSPDFTTLTRPYPHYYRTYERFWLLMRSKQLVVQMMEEEIAGFNSFNFGIKP